MSSVLAQVSGLVVDWPALADRIGWVLIHSLWQLASIAVLLELTLRWMIRASSRARYAVCLAALAFLVVLPAVTYFRLRDESTTAIEVQALDPIGRSSPATGAMAALDRRPNSGAASVRVATEATPNRPGSLAPRAVSSGLHGGRHWLQPWLRAIVGAWIVGVVVFAVRPALSWWTVRRLRVVDTSPLTEAASELFERTVSQLGIRRAVRLAQSKLIRVPAVLGYFRPMVLIPLPVACSFPFEQLEGLFAHELAHIRRHDYLVNLLQTIIETLFFYRPATWWTSYQVRREREDCCDDLALSVCSSQLDYAKALVALEELRAWSPATALAANGGSLVDRIRRIVGVANEPRPGFGAIVSGVLLLAGACLAGVTFSDRSPINDASRFAQATVGEQSGSADVNDRRFRLALPDGAAFELVAVGEDPQDGQSWWRADGTPLTTVPDGELKSLERELPDGHIRRGFALNSLAEPASNVGAPYVVGNSMSSGRTVTSTVDGKVLRKHRFFGTIPTNSRTTVFVAYASGPWKTISIVRPDGSREYPILPNDEGVGFDEPLEVKGSSRIAAAFNVHGDDVRIVAIDTNGREHAPQNVAGAGVGAAHLVSAKFPGLPLSKVKEFRFQRRPWHHVEFRNVSLHSGQKTPVAIYHDGKRYVTDRPSPGHRNSAVANDITRVFSFYVGQTR